MFKFNQKGIAQLFLILLLLLGIVAGVFLVQKTQIFTPKASEGQNYIQIVDKSGNSIQETTDPNVYLKITLPEGWIIASNNNLVREAHAQELPTCPTTGDGTTTTFGETTYDTCIDDAGGGNKDNTLCKNGTKFRCYYSQNNQCMSGVNVDDYNYLCPPPETVTPSADLTPSPSVQIQTISVIRLNGLSIRNNDDLFGGYTGGSPVLNKFSDFGGYLNNPIPWKLNDRKAGYDNGERKVSVKFESQFAKSIFAEAKIILKNNKEVEVTSTPSLLPALPGSITYNVVVYVHRDINYSSEVLTRFNFAIAEINQEFIKLGIKKQFKVDKVYSDESSRNCPVDIDIKGSGCQIGSIYDPKIRVWLYNQDTPLHFKRQGIAYPASLQIGIKVADVASLERRYETNVLAHELGHIFGLPDYYMEGVDAEDNKINKMKIVPFVSDVMALNFSYPVSFHPVSVNYLTNRVEIPIGTTGKKPILYAVAEIYTPYETVLKIVDEKNIPIKNVYVEVFPQTFDETSKKGIIPDDQAAYFGMTSDIGEFKLGSFSKLFHNKKYMPGFSALIRLTKDGDIRYMVVTRSLLNKLFFEGQTGVAEVKIAFYKQSEALSGSYLQSFGLEGHTFIDEEQPEAVKKFLNDERQDEVEKLIEVYSDAK